MIMIGFKKSTCYRVMLVFVLLVGVNVVVVVVISLNHRCVFTL